MKIIRYATPSGQVENGSVMPDGAVLGLQGDPYGIGVLSNQVGLEEEAAA